jgi:hypothetical protein
LRYPILNVQVYDDQKSFVAAIQSKQKLRRIPSIAQEFDFEYVQHHVSELNLFVNSPVFTTKEDDTANVHSIGTLTDTLGLDTWIPLCCTELMYVNVDTKEKELVDWETFMKNFLQQVRKTKTKTKTKTSKLRLGRVSYITSRGQINDMDFLVVPNSKIINKTEFSLV